MVNWFVNDELGTMWNNINMDHITVIFPYLPGVTMQHLSQDSQSLGCISSLGLNKYQRAMITTQKWHLLINNKDT
jgi:hypothetical protein